MTTRSQWSSYCGGALHAKTKKEHNVNVQIKVGKLQIKSCAKNSFFLLTIGSVLSVIHAAGCSAVSQRSHRSVKSAVNRAEVPFETSFFFFLFLKNLPLLGDGRKRREGEKTSQQAEEREGS